MDQLFDRLNVRDNVTIAARAYILDNGHIVPEASADELEYRPGTLHPHLGA